MAEEKKGIFVRLFGQKQKSDCCSMRIEEISEEEEEKAPEQIRLVSRNSSCCGSAPRTKQTDDGAS